MNESTAHADRFRALYGTLRRQFEIPEPDRVDPITQIVIGFLMWEATSDLADETFSNLRDEFVDFNEIRICLPSELAHILGRSYPKARERAERISGVLNDIFRREDSLDLSRLRSRHSAEIERYLTSLEGMTPYVSGQVLLLSFDIPRLPVDAQLREALAREGAADRTINLVDLQNWCTSLIDAREMIGAHLLFQGWVEEQLDKGSASRRSASPPTSEGS